MLIRIGIDLYNNDAKSGQEIVKIKPLSSWQGTVGVVQWEYGIWDKGKFADIKRVC